MVKVKKDRGAKVGRYIIASTTCQYNDPANFWDIPCDLVFPCGPMGSIGKAEISMLSEAGCEGESTRNEFEKLHFRTKY